VLLNLATFAFYTSSDDHAANMISFTAASHESCYQPPRTTNSRRLKLLPWTAQLVSHLTSFMSPVWNADKENIVCKT